MPTVKPHDWLWRCRVRAQNVPDMGQPNNEPDDDADFSDFGWDNYVDNEEVEFDLIAAPPQIVEDEFRVDFVPSRVNMRDLKSKLWDKIEEVRNAEGQQELPFSHCLQELTRESGVSFGVCFACLLHLAIEHNFHIVSNEIGEASIILDS